MNIQTFAYSTIINITKKIYEQKKILTFLKIYLLHIYMNIYIHREHIYIHIYIFIKMQKTKNLKKGHINRYTYILILIHINIIRNKTSIYVQKKQGEAGGGVGPAERERCGVVGGGARGASG